MDENDEIVFEEADEEKTCIVVYQCGGETFQREERYRHVSRSGVRKSTLAYFLRDMENKEAKLLEWGYKPEHVKKIKENMPDLFALHEKC